MRSLMTAVHLLVALSVSLACSKRESEAKADVPVMAAGACVMPRRHFWGEWAGPTAGPLEVEAPGAPGPKFVGLRTDSVLARCGVRNGDRWVSVNGVSMKGESVLAAYAELKKAPRLVMKLLRGQDEITLAINFTE
jgi:hypothetical protein